MKRFTSGILFCIGLCASVFAQQLNLSDIYGSYAYYPLNVHHYTEFVGEDLFLSYGVPTRISLDSLSKNYEAYDFLSKKNIDNSLVNQDGTLLVYSDSVSRVRRYSTKGVYSVYKNDTKQQCALFMNPDMMIMNPRFSPNGKYLSFIFENNLCVTTCDGNYTALTTDGKEGEILNGVGNCIFEEEFDVTDAYAWSPESKKICYMKTNESQISDYPYLTYEQFTPTIRSQKYVFAGAKSPETTYYIYDVASQKTVPVILPDTIQGIDCTYIPHVYWVDEERLLFTIINKAQNHVAIVLYSIEDKKVTVVYSYQSETYVNVPSVIPVPKTNNFLVTDDRSGYNDIYLYDYSGTMISNITEDIPAEVTEVYGFYPLDLTVRFQIVGSTSKDRQVVKKNIFNGRTLYLTPKTGCNEAKFSQSGMYMSFSHTELAADTTSYIVWALVQEARLNPIRIMPLLSSKAMARGMSESAPAYAPVTWFSIPTEGGDSLSAYMIRPVQLQKKHRYPVFVSTYGGPSFQTVLDAADYDYYWYQFLVQQGYIVVVVDPRGSGGKGSKYAKQTYLDFGNKESYDMHAVAQYLKSLPYVDGSKLAINGWSFGGYLSLLAACKYPNDYRAVLSVAPVADWRLYDNIYTEKYMRTPEENPEGYERSSILTYIQDLQASVFLAYGTADDNVRTINEMKIISKAIEYNKDVQTCVFPDDNHSLQNHGSRLFLADRMFLFLENNLK